MLYSQSGCELPTDYGADACQFDAYLAIEGDFCYRLKGDVELAANGGNTRRANGEAKFIKIESSQYPYVGLVLVGQEARRRLLHELPSSPVYRRL